MIIIEGPDGSGKSTLIQNLGHERRHLRALRAGRGADGARKEGWAGDLSAFIAYGRKVMEARREEMQTGAIIAYDRFHLSERVYGPILRGTNEVDNLTLQKLNNGLHSLKIPVIMCLPPFEVTLKNVFKEGRHVPDYQTRDFLRLAYDEFVRLTPWATVVYDFTRDPLPAGR